MTEMETCGAILTIDLDALADNYTLCRHWAGEAECAAAVKADGYGLGIEEVAGTLWRAGCSTFFVAHVDEGAELREILPEASIHVLHGIVPGTAALFRMYDLVPVLNSLRDIAAWRAAGAPGPADLHVDTGMNRLGLPADELAVLAAEPQRLDGIDIALVMSHLACADHADHPMNRRQLAAFDAARRMLPAAPASLANSSGTFLGPEYRFDMVRCGAALYGINPRPGTPNPMARVVRLQGKIVQVRDVDSPQTVGYGATHSFGGPARVATVAVGYADGYLRSLGNRGRGYLGDFPAPVVGRVSMDLISLDVTAVPAFLTEPGALVDLIGPHNPVDAVADAAGTIGYEILTGLGSRYHRVYTGIADTAEDETGT